jgi:CHAT domain-containing protein/tetratricopeptide (TPR) repeat protein
LKASRDPAAFDRFAGLLAGAKTDREVSALLADNAQLLTNELRMALMRRAGLHQSAGLYSQALRVYEVMKMAAQKMGDRPGAAIAEAGLGDANRNLGRSALALEHYRKALDQYEAIGDRLQMAATLDQIGVIYLTQNNYAMAIESFQKQLALFEAGKNAAGLAIALENIGSVHYEQGSYARALEFFEKSLGLRERLGRKAEIAATLNNIGNVHYQQENYIAAIEHYQKAISGFEAHDDKQAIAGAMNNIGSAHYLQGNYDTALEFYEKSFKIEEQIKDKSGQAASLSGIGIVYYAQGDYSRAVEYLTKNIALVESLGNKNRAAETLHTIGLAHARQQNYDAALEAYKRSLKFYEELGSASDAPAMLGLIGDVYYAQSRYDAALESYGKSLAQYEAIKHGEGVASLMASEASVYYAQGKYDAALESYQKSLSEYEKLGNSERVAGALESVASVYYAQGNYAESLEVAERASTLAKANDYFDTLWRARLTAGVDYRALNQPARAQQCFEQSIAAIETMRESLVAGERARQSFFKGKDIPYIAMMELLISQSKIGEAFAYAQRVKANALSDVIQSGGAKITKTMSAAERDRERRLENNIISLKAQINNEKRRKLPDEKRLALLDSQLEHAQADYKTFEAKLYATHPQLKSLRGKSEPLKAEEAASLIADAQTALIDFIVTEGRTYLFALSREQAQSAEIEKTSAPERRSGAAISPIFRLRQPAPALRVYAVELKRKELADRVASFRKVIESRDESVAQQARELHDLLLKPASEQIGGKLRWAIAPDRALWQLPFQALQSSGNRYIIEDHAIAYAPSLTALNEMRKAAARSTRRPPAPLTILAFANPAISKQTAERVRLANKEAKLDPLPEAENEVRALEKLYGPTRSRVYTGAQAREQNAKAEAGNFRALHFAAPAALDDISPMYSRIALAQSDASASEDGLFETREIMNLDLRADFAMLTASESARARVEGGEAITGLAWAFNVAGCPAVLISEWRVDSPGATEMILEFYRNQLARASKAESLQRAALRLLRSGPYKHPFYWAGLRVIGDNR